MALRVTRGFIEGIRALKASEGVADYDVNTMATRQEMRGYVSGPCHVGSYCKGPEKRLGSPWAKGLKVEQIYRVLPRGRFHRLDARRNRGAQFQGPASRFKCGTRAFARAPE